MFKSYLNNCNVGFQLTRFFLVSIFAIFFVGLSGCNSSEPPKPMKAVHDFDTKEMRDLHIANIRNNHKDLLRHKRDETVIRGIRTKKDSLKACIDCHVPASYNGKVLRHTDPEHFCASCHNYVAAKPDCFQCHVDHPETDTTMKTGSKVKSDINPHHTSYIPNSIKQSSLTSVLDHKVAINTASDSMTKNNSNSDVTGESQSE